jgi:hypothetical protein
VDRFLPQIKILTRGEVECLGVFVFSFFIIFISFWEIKKLDGSKNEKLKTLFHELLSFSLF